MSREEKKKNPLRRFDSQPRVKVTPKTDIKEAHSTSRIVTLQNRSKSSRRKSRTVLTVEPRKADEVITLETAKPIIVEIIQKLRLVIKQNDATPEIQTTLNPIVKELEAVFPQFHKQAIKYFENFYVQQNKATSAQVLSTASVHIPLVAFNNVWKNLTTIVDVYADIHPPPHAQEITTKFKAIKSSLEVITQTNSNRKYPSLSLSKCVFSIQALCDSLSENIVHLFMQPQFPNFKSQTFDTYKMDVKGFLHVINEAFYNEFPQSGVLLCDLSRIKVNVLASCNDIISALRSAFIFPIALKEIQTLKNSYNNQTGEIIETLLQPFNVIKPKISGDPISSGRISRQKSQVTFEDDGVKDLTVEQKLALFLVDVLPLMDSHIDNFDDPYDGLLFISKKMRDFIKTNKENAEIIEQKNGKIFQLRQEILDIEEMSSQKSHFVTEVTSQNKSQLDNLNDRIKAKDRQIAELKSEVSKKQHLIDELQDQTDPRYDELRSLVIKLADVEEDTDASDEELIDTVAINYENVIKDRESYIERIANKLNEVYRNDDNLTIEEVIERIENQLNNLKNTKKSLKTIPSNSSISTVQSDTSERGMPRSISNSLIHANRGKSAAEYEELSDTYLNYQKSVVENYQRLSRQLEAFAEPSNPSVFYPDLIIDPIQTQEQIIEIITQQISDTKALMKKLLANDRTQTSSLEKAKDTLNYMRDELKQAIGDIDDEELFTTSIKILTNTQNPLHEQIDGLEKELQDKNFDLDTISTRLHAISGNCEKDDTVFRILDKLQDEKENAYKSIDKMAERNAVLRNSLEELDTRLRSFSNSEEISYDSIGDKELSERVQKLVDLIISPHFSSEYVNIHEIDSIFELIDHKHQHPLEYLPTFVQDFIEMSKTNDELKPFIKMLDSIVNAIDLKSNEYGESNAFSLVATHLDQMNTLLESVDEQIMKSPAFHTLVRFVALTHALVAALE